MDLIFRLVGEMEGYHHDRKNRSEFSDHGRGHGTEYVLAMVEKSTHSVSDRKQAPRLASMELDHNHKAHHRDDRAEKEGGVRPRFKIAKWKYHDLGNKLGHTNDGKDDLEKKETPAMINDGGWARPNRAMWASPPAVSSREHTIEDALDYLRETGRSGSRSRASVKPRPDVNHLPSDVREALDQLREPGLAATGYNSGYRFSVAAPVKK